jgi:hypothetical protein
MWTLENPSVGPNLVVVTLNTPGTMVAGAVSATNVNQVTPIKSAASGHHLSSRKPRVLLAINDGNGSLTVDVLAVGNSVAVTGLGTGQTEEWQRGTTNSPVPPPEVNDVRGVGTTNQNAVITFQALTYKLNKKTPWVMGALALQPVP